MLDATYFKRYRMELNLRDLPPEAYLPAGYAWVPWRDDLIDRHAEIMFHSFRDELDAVLFPSFASQSGCRTLMRAIWSKAAFVPEATWLLAGPSGACGTVQGLRDKYFGSIQNVGVAPEHRGRGLGRLLMLQALHGFRRAGLNHAYLEVTARNDSAVRLYKHLGFKSTRTIYKAIPLIVPEAAVTI